MNKNNKLINFSSTNSVADLFEAKVKTNPEAIAILICIMPILPPTIFLLLIILNQVQEL